MDWLIAFIFLVTVCYLSGEGEASAELEAKVDWKSILEESRQLRNKYIQKGCGK